MRGANYSGRDDMIKAIDRPSSATRSSLLPDAIILLRLSHRPLLLKVLAARGSPEQCLRAESEMLWDQVKNRVHSVTKELLLQITNISAEHVKARLRKCPL